MYKRLKELGRDAELLVLEDEGHTISKHRNRVLAYTRAIGFFKEHLKK